MATCVFIQRSIAVCALALLATAAHADTRVDRSLLNPVTLIGEVIAALRKTIERSEDATFLARRNAALATTGLSVPFATDSETNRITVVLAESELRVQLARDVQLRCDVSSRDEANIDPELQLGIGVHFRFK